MPFTTVLVFSYVQRDSIRMKSGEMSGRRWRSGGAVREGREGTERKEKEKWEGD